MVKLPKISVITPSFNQAEFIEQTILSVIGQQYPNLEYIVIDGGSTDGTLEIIKKYEKNIHYWVSEKDAGQSNAINKGFKVATGDILCWLNSDDYYLPETLFTVASILINSKADLLHGNCIHINEKSNFTHGSYFDLEKKWDINHGDYILQPSSFWTRRTFELTGTLREDLHFGFDWEWFARANSVGVNFISTTRFLSVYRIHGEQKSNNENIERFKELIGIEKQFNPDKFVYINKKLKNDFFRAYILAEFALFRKVKYRILKLLYPKLMKLVDRSYLKRYVEYFYEQSK